MPSWTCWAVDFRKKCFLTRFYTLTLCNVYKGVLVEEKNLEAFLPAAGSPLGTTGPFKCPRRFRQGNPTQSLPALAQSDGWGGRLDYILISFSDSSCRYGESFNEVRQFFTHTPCIYLRFPAFLSWRLQYTWWKRRKGMVRPSLVHTNKIRF